MDRGTDTAALLSTQEFQSSQNIPSWDPQGSIQPQSLNSTMSIPGSSGSLGNVSIPWAVPQNLP